MEAFHRDDAAAVREILRQNSELRKRINDPVGPFDSPAIINVRSRAMLDALLEAGADINARSKWWAGGFGLLDSASEDLAHYAITRGAIVDGHAAARLGLMDRLRALVTRDPNLVHARGGDGKTPLHFAKNVEVATFLVENGADINALDIDHESTPAQHLISEHQDVVRYLVQKGCATDIFLAAALGDAETAKKHLSENPDCVRMRVDSHNFPMKNHRAGGTIYQWTLGFHVSPHQAAKKFGNQPMVALLMQASPPEVRLINWCWLENEQEVKDTLQTNPGLISRLSETERRGLADAARNNQARVVELMLEAGFPTDARGQHWATPLHWAAWHGNDRMVQALLKHGARVDVSDVEFPGTPLNWAVHGSQNGWYCDKGDYGATVKSLLAAGSARPSLIGGSPAVREALER